jgi:CelD/BcsL family acetyltransferase involved in cellulose biosynthesis
MSSQISRAADRSASCSVTELTSLEELNGLRPEWSRLWQQCPWATPFQSPEWLLPWWEHLGRGDLWVIAVRKAGELIGLAPLFIWKGRALFLGTGVSDYLDMLVSPGQNLHQSATLFFDYMAESSDKWEFCDLQEIRAESPLITAEKPHNVLCSTDPLGICPVLVLSGIPEPSQSDHPVLRTSYRKAWRNIRNNGNAWVETAREENLDSCLDALFRLHGARWAKRRHPGVLSDLKIRGFHRKAARGLLAGGCLRLYCLYFEGEIIAALYAFEQNKKVYCYLSGFNPRLERLSPGKIILGHAIENAIRSGISEVDFLRGSESYKYQWGVRDRPNYRIVLKHGDDAE